LQRMIRKHQHRNIERSNLLMHLFDRGLLPLVNHIRLVASGKSFATKNLTEIELAAITRMAGKYTDPLRLVAAMKDPSFHVQLMRSFPSEVRAHAKHLRMRAEHYAASTGNSGSNSHNMFSYYNNPDFPHAIKRRVCLDFFYHLRRTAIRKKHEEKFRVVIAPVTLHEVREYIRYASAPKQHMIRAAAVEKQTHRLPQKLTPRQKQHSADEYAHDPLSRNICAMIEYQNNTRYKTNDAKSKTNETAAKKIWRPTNRDNIAYTNVATGLTPIAFAELYFMCDDYYISYLRSLTARNVAEYDDRAGTADTGNSYFDEVEDSLNNNNKKDSFSSLDDDEEDELTRVAARVTKNSSTKGAVTASTTLPTATTAATTPITISTAAAASPAVPRPQMPTTPPPSTTAPNASGKAAAAASLLGDDEKPPKLMLTPGMLAKQLSWKSTSSMDTDTEELEAVSVSKKSPRKGKGLVQAVEEDTGTASPRMQPQPPTTLKSSKQPFNRVGK
jgi:hypothetical protein